MFLKRVYSIIILFAFVITLAHNFVPHHHHDAKSDIYSNIHIYDCPQQLEMDKNEANNEHDNETGSHHLSLSHIPHLFSLNKCSHNIEISKIKFLSKFRPFVKVEIIDINVSKYNILEFDLLFLKNQNYLNSYPHRGPPLA